MRQRNIKSILEIDVATELSSGAITNILEAVPGIATVLRSPVADAIVNLSRAAAGLIPFDKKDAHELIKYAVRRGLIRSDEGDRVTQDVDTAPKRLVAAPPPPKKSAAKKAVVKKHVMHGHAQAHGHGHAHAKKAVHKAAHKKPVVKKK
jgi:hypothetical protein